MTGAIILLIACGIAGGILGHSQVKLLPTLAVFLLINAGMIAYTVDVLNLRWSPEAGSGGGWECGPAE